MARLQPGFRQLKRRTIKIKRTRWPRQGLGPNEARPANEGGVIRGRLQVRLGWRRGLGTGTKERFAPLPFWDIARLLLGLVT